MNNRNTRVEPAGFDDLSSKVQKKQQPAAVSFIDDGVNHRKLLHAPDKLKALFFHATYGRRIFMAYK